MQWAVISRVGPSVGSGHLWGRLMWLIDIKNSVEMMLMWRVRILTMLIVMKEIDFVSGPMLRLVLEYFNLIWMRRKDECWRGGEEVKSVRSPLLRKGNMPQKCSLVSSSHKLSLLWKCAQCNSEIWALLCEVGWAGPAFASQGKTQERKTISRQTRPTLQFSLRQTFLRLLIQFQM